MSSDDLINLSTPPAHSTSLEIPNIPHQDEWMLEPDPPGSNRLSSLDDQPQPSITPSTQTSNGVQVSRSSTGDLVSIAERSTHRGVSTPTGAEAIPLPSSPDDAETRSSTSRSTQSTLSAAARPFEARQSVPATTSGPTALRVARTQSPLSFFSTDTRKSITAETAETANTGREAPWSDDGSRVSTDEMDPMYYQPGFGGCVTKPPSTEGQPSQFNTSSAQPPNQSNNITKREQDTQQPGVHSIAPSTISDTTKTEKSQNSKGIPTPASMTFMQESATRSPSFGSSSSASPRRGCLYLHDDESDEDSHPEPDITESFRSISLSPDVTPPDSGIHHRYAGASSAHSGDKLVSIAGNRTSDALIRSQSSNQYIQGQGGMLTPDNTGGSHNSAPPSATTTSTVDDRQERDIREESDTDDNRISVSHTAILESVLTLDETNNIDRAFVSFDDAVGRFRHEVEEGLTRLRQGALRQQQAVQGASQFTSQISSSLPTDIHLASARQAALVSQLQGTRTKLGQASQELADLKVRLDKSNEQLRVASIQVRVEEAARLNAAEKLSQSKRRSQELAGRLIRLEEKHEILENLHRERPDDQFMVVLLEGDGRMFDPKLFCDPTAGRRLIADTVDRLAEQFYLIDGRFIDQSKIVVHLFIDIEAAGQELRAVDWISNRGVLIRHLDGIREGHSLASVTDVPGLEGDGSCITSWMRFYERLAPCRMIVLGTGWIKPYRDLVAEWQKDERIEKLYTIRSTVKFDVDPFKDLGPDKLLYVDRLWSTGVSKWKALQSGVRPGDLGSVSTRQTSTASRTSTATDQTTSSITPRANRVYHSRTDSPISCRVPTPPTSISKPPWQVQMAPRPESRESTVQTGGSLLDQFMSMRSGTTATTSTTRPSSPTSDRTVGPQSSSHVLPHQPVIELEITSEGGGSPPSSDSDDPSVPLPHSARKFVRRPITFADEDTGNQSDTSAFTESSVGGSTTRRNHPRPPLPIKIKHAPKSSFATSKFLSRNVSAASVSNSNATPLGGARPASGSRAVPQVPDMIDLDSRRAQSTVHGFRWHDAQSSARARRDTPGYKYLRSLRPRPCHQLHLSGRCSRLNCKYGHQYNLNRAHLDKLRLLAKQMNCKRESSGCNGPEEDYVLAVGSLTQLEDIYVNTMT